MNERKKKLLARQLSQQAASLTSLEGAGLAAKLLANAAALVRAADMASVVEGCKDEEFDRLMAESIGLAEAISALFDSSKGRLERAATSNEVNELARSLKDKTEQASKLANRHDELEKELAEVEQRLRDLPPENAEMKRRFDDLAAQLDDLQDAERDYGPDRQQKLQDQIDELQPNVEQLEQETQLLQRQLEDLRVMQLNYERGKAVLSDDAGLTQWLGSDTAQLDAQARERHLFVTQAAAQTITDESMKRARRIRSEVNERLRELDGMLGLWTKAAQGDYKAANGSARQH